MHCSRTGLLDCLAHWLAVAPVVYTSSKSRTRAPASRGKNAGAAANASARFVYLSSADKALCGAVAFVRRSAPASRRGKAAFCAAVLPCAACALRSAASDDAQGTSFSQMPNLSLCASVSKAPGICTRSLSAHVLAAKTFLLCQIRCSHLAQPPL